MRIIVQDDFDDNSFDTTKWTKYEYNNATCTETNQRIELKTSGLLTKGAGFYSNPLPIQGIYLLEAEFWANPCQYTSGYRGIFIRRSADYGRDSAYKAPNNGIMLTVQWHPCGAPGACEGATTFIYYHDSNTAFHCPFGTLIDSNCDALWSASTLYDIKILFNGMTGKLEYWVDGTEICSATMSAAQLSWLAGGTGNKIAFEFYMSAGINEIRENRWDNVRIVDLIANKPIFV